MFMKGKKEGRGGILGDRWCRSIKEKSCGRSIIELRLIITVGRARGEGKTGWKVGHWNSEACFQHVAVRREARNWCILMMPVAWDSIFYPPARPFCRSILRSVFYNLDRFLFHGPRNGIDGTERRKNETRIRVTGAYKAIHVAGITS